MNEIKCVIVRKYSQKLTPFGLHLIIASSRQHPAPKNTGTGSKYTKIGRLRNVCRSVFDTSLIRYMIVQSIVQCEIQ